MNHEFSESTRIRPKQTSPAKPLPIGVHLIRSFPVDFASLHPSGCLWQSTSHLPRRSVVVRISGLPPPLPLMSPFGLPSAGLVRIPPGMSHPSGCSCSLPRKPPFAWFPASARSHVFRSPQTLFHSPCFQEKVFCFHSGSPGPAAPGTRRLTIRVSPELAAFTLQGG